MTKIAANKKDIVWYARTKRRKEDQSIASPPSWRFICRLFVCVRALVRSCSCVRFSACGAPVSLSLSLSLSLSVYVTFATVGNPFLFVIHRGWRIALSWQWNSVSGGWNAHLVGNRRFFSPRIQKPHRNSFSFFYASSTFSSSLYINTPHAARSYLMIDFHICLFVSHISARFCFFYFYFYSKYLGAGHILYYRQSHTSSVLFMWISVSSGCCSVGRSLAVAQ